MFNSLTIFKELNIQFIFSGIVVSTWKIYIVDSGKTGGEQEILNV